MRYIEVISAGVVAATLLVLIVQTYLLRKQLREEHEFRRRDRSLQFSQIHSKDLRELKKRLNQELGYIQSREDPLTMEALNQAFQKCPDLKDDVNFFLAYLENIGLAVRHHIASFKVVYDMLGNTYLKYWYLFQPYIMKSREHNPRLWENVEFLAGEFETERKKRKEEPVRLPKLG